jgi:hypothetical protein
VWTSSRGICSGGSNGNFINHSIGILSIPEAVKGTAIVKDQGGFRNYITTLYGETTPYNSYNYPLEVNTI